MIVQDANLAKMWYLLCFKSTCTSRCKIKKVANFTHFCSKTTHISLSETLFIYKIATVTVHIRKVIVAIYMIILFYFSLSTLTEHIFSLSSPHLFIVYRRPPCLAPLQPNHHHHHHHHHYCNSTTIATHPIVMSDHFQNKREREREREYVSIWNNKNDYLKKIYCIIDKLM